MPTLYWTASLTWTNTLSLVLVSIWEFSCSTWRLIRPATRSTNGVLVCSPGPPTRTNFPKRSTIARSCCSTVQKKRGTDQTPRISNDGHLQSTLARHARGQRSDRRARQPDARPAPARRGPARAARDARAPGPDHPEPVATPAGGRRCGDDGADAHDRFPAA